MLSEALEPLAPVQGSSAAHEEQELPNADGEAVQAQDELGLASLSLPASSIRRIARSAAPGVRFSSEAFAGLHRVAQAFILFATDRALAEVKVEADKGKRPKGKSTAPIPRKTLSCDHVMRFLSSELPPIASKVAALFPQLMSSEFKPAGVQLLEQLHEQQKAAARTAAAEAAAAEGGHQRLVFGAGDAAGSAASGAGALDAQEGVSSNDIGAADRRHPPQKRPGDGTDNPAKATKKLRHNRSEPADNATVPPASEGQGKKAEKERPASASLTRFFGARPAAAPAGPPPPPAEGSCDPPGKSAGEVQAKAGPDPMAPAVFEDVRPLPEVPDLKVTEVVFEEVRLLMEEDAQVRDVTQ